MLPSQLYFVYLPGPEGIPGTDWQAAGSGIQWFLPRAQPSCVDSPGTAMPLLRGRKSDGCCSPRPTFNLKNENPTSTQSSLMWRPNHCGSLLLRFSFSFQSSPTENYYCFRFLLPKENTKPKHGHQHWLTRRSQWQCFIFCRFNDIFTR